MRPRDEVDEGPLINAYFGPITLKPGETTIPSHQRHVVRRLTNQIQAWMAGVLDLSDIYWATIFRELSLAGTLPDFYLHIMRNENFMLRQDSGKPINRTYFFEIARFDNDGHSIPGTERVGCFDATATFAESPTNPLKAGVSFFVYSLSLKPSLTWDDLENGRNGFATVNFRALKAKGGFMEHVMNFFDIYPKFR